MAWKRVEDGTDSDITPRTTKQVNAFGYCLREITTFEDLCRLQRMATKLWHNYPLLFSTFNALNPKTSPTPLCVPVSLRMRTQLGGLHRKLWLEFYKYVFVYTFLQDI